LVAHDLAARPFSSDPRSAVQVELDSGDDAPAVGSQEYERVCDVLWVDVVPQQVRRGVGR
jgi:hypothetical protein